MARKKKKTASQQSIVDSQQSIVGNQQSTVDSQQSTVDSQQWSIDNRKSVTHGKKNKIIDKQVSKKIKKEEVKFANYELINKEILLRKKSKDFDEINKLMNKIDNFLFNEFYLDSDSVFLLAVSGGFDSVTLMDIFANMTAKYPIMKICVAHFNHRLRKESSDKDEEFVLGLCKSYNIPCFTEKGNVKEYSEIKSISIELAARILRYKFLERMAQKTKAQYIVTAHTADDSAETFFINLFRGSGLTGLSGIPQKRAMSKKVTLVRPLLNLRKKELINYAKLRKLEWREDESNQLLQYTRNKIRLEIIPKIEEHFSPSVIETINRAQKLLQGADTIVSKYVQKAITALIKDKSSGRFSIRLSLLSTIDSFLQGEIIQKVISSNFNLPFIPMQTIDRIIELEDKPVGTICEINKNYFVLRDRDSLIFSKTDKPSEVFLPIKKEGEFIIEGKKVILEKIKRKNVKFTANPNIEFIDWDLIPSVLYLRNWRQGDVFKPLGMEGTMKVSDFLTNNKVSLIDKNKVLLLTTKSEVVWICAMRLSDTFKVTENTSNFLKVEYKTD